MLNKLRLYISTVRSMRPSQVYYRLVKKAGLGCSIGCRPPKRSGSVHPVQTLPELDFDPVFLARFSPEEWMEDQVTFLHESRRMNWEQKWDCEDRSPLWNFNLHYFEYLFPLLDAYRRTGEAGFLAKAQEMILSWIRENPMSEHGNAWSPYTIDLRLTNWLSFYTYAVDDLSDLFKEQMVSSIYQQFDYLSSHLEKDILGNHYFEDLKALILCAIFFEDETMLEKACRAFRKECREEILPDGMHFELSPMYHDLIWEGLMRVCAALRQYGSPDSELEGYLQSMLNASWSLEKGIDRLPLFNDAGSNIAKSLDSLVLAAKNHFDIDPVFTSVLSDAGYYIFERNGWKLVVDAGRPGPSYIPGHAHCDGMSFELFYCGKPFLVNCGTYAYQSELRSFFRSTAAHNTVMVNGVEQSQCWSTFRMAKRSSISVVSANGERIVMELTDQKGQRVRRSISFGSTLTVTDETKCGNLTAFLHFLRPMDVVYDCQDRKEIVQFYSPEYGLKKEIQVTKYDGKGRISVQISLNSK